MTPMEKIGWFKKTDFLLLIFFCSWAPPRGYTFIHPSVCFAVWDLQRCEDSGCTVALASLNRASSKWCHYAEKCSHLKCETVFVGKHHKNKQKKKNIIGLWLNFFVLSHQTYFFFIEVSQVQLVFSPHQCVSPLKLFRFWVTSFFSFNNLHQPRNGEAQSVSVSIYYFITTLRSDCQQSGQRMRWLVWDSRLARRNQ